MVHAEYSFVIPAYNDEKGIARHLEFFSRRQEALEVIIVDDCSTDDTEGVIARFEMPNNIKLIYHKQDQNSGPGAARNLGASLASGEYLTFIDADDVICDSFFFYIKSSVLKNGADFVIYKYHLAAHEDDPLTYEMHEVDRSFFSSIGSSRYPAGMFSLREVPGVLKTVNFPWNKTYNRDFYVKSGICFPEARYHEDIQPHWMSFLKSSYFGILGWAPPLVVHFESPEGERATNYIGEMRLQLFPMLEDISKEIQHHETNDELYAAYDGFTEDVFSWLINGLCRDESETSLFWKERYQAEIEVFKAKSQEWRREN
nr:glycosyltransferase family A protein [uncultured Cohaesibacter sp.]